MTWKTNGLLNENEKKVYQFVTSMSQIEKKTSNRRTKISYGRFFHAEIEDVNEQIKFFNAIKKHCGVESYLTYVKAKDIRIVVFYRSPNEKNDQIKDWVNDKLDFKYRDIEMKRWIQNNFSCAELYSHGVFTYGVEKDELCYSRLWYSYTKDFNENESDNSDEDSDNMDF